jgi:hypothetical protein
MARLIRAADGSGLAITLLTVTLQRTAHLHEPFARVLRDAGRHGRYAPVAAAKEPNQAARPPRRPELLLLVELMGGLVAADRSGQLEPVGTIGSLLPRVRLPDPAAAGRGVTVEVSRSSSASSRRPPRTPSSR